jgi:hypothetical protein
MGGRIRVAHDQVQGRRQAFDEYGQQLVAVRIGDRVVVVQHRDRRAGLGGQFVQQQRLGHLGQTVWRRALH